MSPVFEPLGDKIKLMDSKTFNLEEIGKYIEEKTTELVEKKFRPAEEIILDDLDLQKLLNISRRTSLEWRRKGYLRYHRMGGEGIKMDDNEETEVLKGRIYYFLSEVIEDIKKRQCN